MNKIQNHILYVDQFTGVFRESTYLSSCVPNKIGDVFAYYKPCLLDIELKTEEGEIVYESFQFKNLSDFNDEEIIAKSSTLSSLYERFNYSPMASRCLKENLRVIHEESDTLEVTYRTLDLFFQNAINKLNGCLTLVNVNRAKLGNYDSCDTDAVKKELIKGGFRILVVPGYLGSASAVRWWADMANHYEVIMFTDYTDCQDYDMLITELDTASLQGQGYLFKNMVMTCNYVSTANPGKNYMGEERILYVPASPALAGKMANIQNLKVHNNSFIGFGHVKGIHIDLNDRQVEKFIDKGIVPIVKRHNYTSRRVHYGGIIKEVKDFSQRIVLHLIHTTLLDAEQRFLSCASQDLRNGDECLQGFNENILNFCEVIDEYLSEISRNGLISYGIRIIVDYRTKHIGIEIKINDTVLMLPTFY